MTLDFFERFRENVTNLPDRVALTKISKDGSVETFTYEQIAREVVIIGGFLLDQGIQPGQKIGILMENHPRWGVAFLAAQSAGAIIVPLDIQHSAETLAGLIEHAECCWLIVSEKIADESLSEIESELSETLPILQIGGKDCDGPEWDQLLSEYEGNVSFDDLPLISRDLEETNIILYTSGTTGDPKGVVLSKKAIFLTVVALLEKIEVQKDDRILGVLPLYHILALMVNFIIPLYAGAACFYLDFLEAQRILKTFRDEKITIFVCIPQFYYLLQRRIFQEVEKQSSLKKLVFFRLLTLSRFLRTRFGLWTGRKFFSQIHEPFGDEFRLFGVGGARFDPDAAQTFGDLGFTLVQAYGMTETSAVSTATLPRGGGLGTVGRPLPHVEIRIDSPDDQGIGEVLIRGEHLMKEYWKNPRATKETLDSEGWLHSGDLGYVDEAGFLRITGRKKDVIVLSSGKNIFPEEIEQFYEKSCRFIKEMCVVGMETEAGNEKLHAVVVPDFDYVKSQQVANISEMIRYKLENLSPQLPSHKRVHSFEVWKEPLPRTTTRKIRRFEVEESLGEGGTSEAATEPEEYEPSGRVETRVADMIREIKPGAVIGPKKNLELDIDLDSLERVELLSNLQDSFGIQIPDEEAVSVHTFEELVEVVESHIETEDFEEGPRRKSWKELLDRPLTDEDKERVEQRLRRRPFVEFLFYLFARANLIVQKLLFRLKVEGLENLPRDFPYLICPNHLSFMDAFVVGAPLPYKVLKRMFALGYSDYFRTGLTGFLGTLVKVIPVDPDRNLRQALRLAAEGLKRDYVLCVFPEGERSIDGTLKSFRKGPAILATKFQIPVVPTGILGTYEAWPRGSNKIRLRPVTVRYGQPIVPDQDEEADEFNERLFEEVEKLIDQGR